MILETSVFDLLNHFAVFGILCNFENSAAAVKFHISPSLKTGLKRVYCPFPKRPDPLIYLHYGGLDKYDSNISVLSARPL